MHKYFISSTSNQDKSLIQTLALGIGMYTKANFLITVSIVNYNI